MTYYDTIEEDLALAKKILERGKPTPDDLMGVPPPLHAIFMERSGVIYGADTYAAYKLLESFVAEIERMREEEPGPAARMFERDAEIDRLRRDTTKCQACSGTGGGETRMGGPEWTCDVCGGSGRRQP